MRDGEIDIGKGYRERVGVKRVIGVYDRPAVFDGAETSRRFEGCMSTCKRTSGGYGAVFFFDDLATLNNKDDNHANEVISTNLIKQGNNDNNSDDISLPHLPSGTVIHVLKGRSIIDKRNDGTVKSDCVTWLANIRLPQVSTDILITLSLPIETIIVSLAREDIVLGRQIISSNFCSTFWCFLEFSEF